MRFIARELTHVYSHTPVREICSEGVIPLDDLRDFWWASCRMTGYNMVQKHPRKIKPREEGARTSLTTDRQTDRQTDGFAMPLSKRNVT